MFERIVTKPKPRCTDPLFVCVDSNIINKTPLITCWIFAAATISIAAAVRRWEPYCIAIFSILQTILFIQQRETVTKNNGRPTPIWLGFVLFVGYLITVLNSRLAAIVSPGVVAFVATAHWVHSRRTTIG